jgi:hypothetical protein
MGILTYIKIGAAVVILAVCGYFVYQYKHMQTTITELKGEIADLKLRAEVIEKAQATTDEFMKKKATIQTRVVKERANVDKVIEAKDDEGMKQLFINQGLLMPDPKSAPR